MDMFGRGERWQQIAAGNPIGRNGTPEEVGGWVGQAPQLTALPAQQILQTKGRQQYPHLAGIARGTGGRSHVLRMLPPEHRFLT